MKTSACSKDDSTPTSPESWKSGSEDILAFIRSSRDSFNLRGAHPSALAYLLARGLKTARKPFLLVAPTDREAQAFVESVSFFFGKTVQRPDAPLDRRVWYLPSRTEHKAESLGKMEATARRMETLYALRSAPSPILVVTS
ncbi:MAG: hypothetical protein ACLGPL_08470, partial [Acidobacteriota bacterium]